MPSDLWYLQQEEEAKKKRQRLLSAGVTAGVAPAPQHSPERVWRDYEQAHPPQPVAKTQVLKPAQDDHKAFIQRYDELVQSGSRKIERYDNPVSEFARLSQQSGSQAKVEKRITDIANLWSVYMAPFKGSASVWDLVKSPYETDQIEEMLKSARGRLMNPGDRERDFPASWMEQQGFNSGRQSDQALAHLQVLMGGYKEARPKASPSSVLDAALGVQGMQGDLSTDEYMAAQSEPMAALSGRTGMEDWLMTKNYARTASGMKKATDAATMLSILLPVGAGLEGAGLMVRLAASARNMAVGFSAVGTVVSAGSQKIVANNIAAMQREAASAQQAMAATSVLPTAASNLYNTEALVTQSDSVFAKVDSLSAKISGLKGSDARAVQRELDKMGLWKDANGKPLAIDGKWDYGQREAVLGASRDIVREGIDFQTQAMTEGWASRNATVDGNTETPYWKAVKAAMELDRVGREKVAREDPEHYAFMDAANLPMTPEGASKMWRELQVNGYWQALYSSPIKIAEHIGEGYQAIMAAADLAVRKRRDVGYQDAEKKLLAYVDANATKDADYEGPLGWVPGVMNAGYANYQVKAGSLKDDPEAARLLNEVHANAGRLISQRYSQAYLLTLQYLDPTRKPADIEQWGQDNPDIVYAGNIAIDLGMALVNPIGRTRRFVTRPTITRGEGAAEAFENANRAQKYAGRVTRAIVTDKIGSVTGDAWGSEMNALIQRVMGTKSAVDTSVEPFIAKVQGKKAVAPKGKQLRPDTLVVENKATALHDAVVAQDVAAIAKEIGGNAAVAQKVLDDVAKAIPKAKSLTSASRYDQDAVIRASVQKTVAREYAKAPEIISRADIDAAVKQASKEWWAQGRSVYMFMQNRRVTPKGGIKLGFENAIQDVGYEPARRFLTQTVANLYYRAPLVEKAYTDVGTLDRIMDAAVQISGDARWAADFRGRWAMAHNEVQYAYLADELSALVNARFKIGKQTDFLADMPQQIASTIAGKKGLTQPRHTMAVNPDPAAPASEWGAAIGKYPKEIESGHVFDTVAVVPDSTYMAYKLRLYKGVLWAPLKTEELSNLAKYSAKTRNVGRFATRTMQAVSSPLRRFTVAFGAPLLATKHTLTDTSRTFLEYDPTTILKGMGNSKARRIPERVPVIGGKTFIPEGQSVLKRRYDRMLEQVSPEIAQMVQYRQMQSHASEVQWNTGLHSVAWTPKAVRDSAGRVTDLDQAAHALRRISDGEQFGAWARGGEDGLRDFLDTTEGRRLLRMEGHLRRERDLAKLGNLEKLPGETTTPVPVGKALHDRAVERYVHEFVNGEWVRLEQLMPKVFGDLKDAAATGRRVNHEGIKNSILQNPLENAVLPMETGRIGTGALGKDPASAIVGKAMAMNKWNRDVVFHKSFTDTFGAMRKDGIDADQAARVASDIASAEVARVHFDLANALSVEAKHRWFAWFATKHRLYGTYLGKMALERPWVASAALGVKDWLEASNEGADEFDKYKLKVDVPDWVPQVGGTTLKLNVAPVFWLSDYPLESSLGSLIEGQGFNFVNRIAGKDVLQASPTPFGLSTGRWDAAVKTIWEMYVQGPTEKGDALTEQELHDWLDAKSKDVRDGINRGIAVARAEAAYRGEDIDVITAFNRARSKAFGAELWYLWRPVSGGFQEKSTAAIDVDMDKYFELAKTDSNAAYDFLRTHPWVGIRFNAVENAVDKVQLDAGHRKRSEIEEETARQLNALYDSGEIYYNDSMKAVITWRDDEIKKLVSNPASDTYNQIYAEWYNKTEQKDVDAALGVLFPMVDVSSVLRSGAMPDQERIDGVRATAKAEFEKALEEYGLSETDTSVPLYKALSMAKQERIRKTLGFDPDNLWSGYQETAARFMARGGADGAFKADTYLDTLKDANLRVMMMSGTRDGRGAKTDPFMLRMTADEKAAMGWNPSPKAQEGWRQWAELQWALKKYQKDNGIPYNRKVDGAVQWKKFEEVSLQMAQANPEWGREWALSRLDLVDRLREFGVGTGNDKQSQGWDDFLNVVTAYNQALDQAVVYTTNSKGERVATKKRGVGPKAGSAYSVTVEALGVVAQLAERNPEWWKMFSQTSRLSKFGFYWRRKDKVDDNLWNPDEPVLTAPEQDVEDYWDIYQEVTN